MIEELQHAVITLSRENKDLNERNEQFRTQLMEIGAKVSGNETNSVWINVIVYLSLILWLCFFELVWFMRFLIHCPSFQMVNW
jgi:hypothetical protein